MFEKRLAEIKARKAEIRSLLETDDKDVDLEKLDEELKSLNSETEKIEKRRGMADGIKAGSVETRVVDSTKTAETADAEKRGEALKEGRSVTVTSSDLVVPAHQAKDIKPTFNEVSGLIDRVNVMNLLGGESFTQPYLEGYGTGDYETETTAYATAEPTFNYATMSKAKVTAYAEVSEEVLKLPAANYEAEVLKGIRIALRKKITGQILAGDGESNHLVGIFDDDAAAIDAATDIDIAEIDETTLDEILYGFGGDEDVEDVAVLVLSKLSLKAFATLRDSMGKKIHDVVNRGNVGTIDGIPYIINSACDSLATAGSGDYLMAYGPLSNYTLAILSNIDVRKSTDFKFSTGLVAYRGDVFAAGNVTAKDGFLRIEKT